MKFQANKLSLNVVIASALLAVSVRAQGATTARLDDIGALARQGGQPQLQVHQALVIGRRHRGVGKDQMQLPCQRPGRGTRGRRQLQRVQCQRGIVAGGR